VEDVYSFSTLKYFYLPLSSEHRWHALISKVKDYQLTVTVGLFRSAGIETVLIKGIVSARFYPSHHPRDFVDHDFAVASADFLRARGLVNEARSQQINIDLHSELRHLDTLEWSQILNRSETLEIGEVRVRVPCPEDHLRIMAVHWLNDGGQYKERLWDIYYAVANRPAGFDWDKCLGIVSPTRRKWVITTIGLANKYLGLPIDDLPFADEARDIPEWIIRTVEAEWASDIRLQSLHVVWRDPKQLLQQIRKRIPPNPIQATIETEGEFDDSSRLKYQVRNIARRLIPSIRRISSTIVPTKK
jgi:hypothetical protein